MPFNHLILFHPLLLLPSVFLHIRVFWNESVWSFSISPSNEYSGLISFRIDWFDHLTVQGTLKSLLQHHSSKASIFRCLAFFTVQLLHPYMTTGKTIALTRWTFVGRVRSLLFNMLSKFAIAFLSRSKPLKMNGSWWRILRKCGPLETGMANHFNILAWRTPWIVYDKGIGWGLRILAGWQSEEGPFW